MSNPNQVDSSMWEKGLKADDCVDCGKIFYSKGRSSRCLSCYNKIQTSSEKLIYQCPRCTKRLRYTKTTSGTIAKAISSVGSKIAKVAPFKEKIAYHKCVSCKGQTLKINDFSGMGFGLGILTQTRLKKFLERSKPCSLNCPHCTKKMVEMDLSYSLEKTSFGGGFGSGGDHPAAFLMIIVVILILVIFSSAAKSQQSKQRRMIIDGCKDCNLFWFDEDELEELMGSSEITARKDSWESDLDEWLEADPTEWIDKKSKNNIKLYDTEGNIIVIGTPTAKIDTQKTYDIEGNVIDEASVTVGVKPAVANKRKVIFMDSDSKTKADEIKKLKRLYEEGYLTKERYNSLKKDLN